MARGHRVVKSVFESERDLARRFGLCMACDKPTRQFATGRYLVVCQVRDCKLYYLSLYKPYWRAMRLKKERS